MPDKNKNTAQRKPNPGEHQALLKLSKRAVKGDEAALAEMRAYLDQHPEVWRYYGDLVEMAEEAVIREASEGDPLAWECLSRKQAEFRDCLESESDHPLEKMLVKDVTLSLLRYSTAQFRLAALENAQMTPAVIDAQAKRAGDAQKRFHSAVKQLATVRKLLQRTPSALELLGRPSAESRPVGGRLGERRNPEPALN